MRETLQAGQTYALRFFLKTAEGTPVTLDDLEEAHTAKVHLLVVDESLTDYHHLHPVAADEAGAYSFSFQPNTSNNYIAWVDIKPVGGAGQKPAFLMMGDSSCVISCVDKKLSRSSVAGGYTFKVDFGEAPLKAGGMREVTLDILDATGQSVQILEPVMGAYAHIVGFYDDLKTVAHLHPMGEEPATADLRGASPLKLMLHPEKAGFVRFFIQVVIGGKEIFAPVSVNIED
jgi:hypothetical protein